MKRLDISAGAAPRPRMRAREVRGNAHPTPPGSTLTLSPSGLGPWVWNGRCPGCHRAALWLGGVAWWALVLLLMGRPGGAAAAGATPAALERPPYAPGERMGFSINYLGMRMGTATISVSLPQGPLLSVELEAHTTGLAGAFYAFREKLVSTLEPETGLPVVGVVDTDERGWRHRDTTRYERREGLATVRGEGKSISTDVLAVEPGTVDFIALVFLLRRMPLEPGATHTFSVLSGTTLRAVVTEVMRRETVRTNAGTFPTVKIRVPTGFSGKFSEQRPTYLWLSDDARRIVVRIATDFSFGGAVAELVSYRPGLAAGADGLGRQ
jgi:hypothetical protein